MKKLCVFTLYSEKGASSQYRAYIFKEDLSKNFEVEWHYFWNDKYVEKYMHNKRKYVIPIMCLYFVSAIKRILQFWIVAPRCDVVFIQKAVIPKCKRIFMGRIKRRNVRVVYDVDDAVYLNSRDTSFEVAKMADVVICGNENLRQEYAKYNQSCIIVPTIEKTSTYERFWGNTFDKKVIGWIGSSVTINNLDLIINPINNIVNRHPEVKTCIISNSDEGYTSKIKNSFLILWNKDTYIEELSKITIGIMPLKDNEYNKGKCGFKLVQYLNMKKPVVASDVGVNSEIVSGNGMVIKSELQWEQAIENLLFNEKTYNNYIENIERDFFAKYHYGKIVNCIMEILDK